jgi:hypothetical protein
MYETNDLYVAERMNEFQRQAAHERLVAEARGERTVKAKPVLHLNLSGSRAKFNRAVQMAQDIVNRWDTPVQPTLQDCQPCPE